MLINVVIYTRTSLDCPLSGEIQIEHLNAVAADHGWTVTQVFAAHPMPLQRGRERRPGEIALLDAIRRGGVQKVLIFSVDRVGRSLVELVNFMEICRTACVGLYLHEQILDTEASNEMSLFDLAILMAYHLRQSRRDRILRGQAVARAASVRFGRPPIPAAKVERPKAALAVGTPVRRVARMTGMSPASVSRLKNRKGSISEAA